MPCVFLRLRLDVLPEVEVAREEGLDKHRGRHLCTGRAHVPVVEVQLGSLGRPDRAEVVGDDLVVVEERPRRARRADVASRSHEPRGCARGDLLRGIVDLWRVGEHEDVCPFCLCGLERPTEILALCQLACVVGTSAIRIGPYPAIGANDLPLAPQVGDLQGTGALEVEGDLVRHSIRTKFVVSKLVDDPV